jgi:predicted flap endonuclease-1-like 5' DNA nuclease
MAIPLWVALTGLGLAIGFILTWAFKTGSSISLFLGLLLVVAGGIVGFIAEWLIDEAYRKNRELQRQLNQRRGTPLSQLPNLGSLNDGVAAETLADFMRQREEEARALREEFSATRSQLESLREEFDGYQRTHPDALTVIKGIGPVYQWKLRDAGVNTYQQLATADPGQLRRMLDIKHWQRVDVESWIEQANDWAQRDN